MDQQDIQRLLNSDPNAWAIVNALRQGVRSTEQLVAVVPHPQSFNDTMSMLIAFGIIGPPE
ncbi:MAG: hypothetical protein IJ026_07720 [Candidatus Methanomethylophilaceae archaeon]|nr:hypothetical protein [Candidatus Methanomethylophilaceae archaeon]